MIHVDFREAGDKRPRRHLGYARLTSPGSDRLQAITNQKRCQDIEAAKPDLTCLNLAASPARSHCVQIALATRAKMRNQDIEGSGRALTEKYGEKMHDT